MEEQQKRDLIQSYQLTPDVLNKPVSDEHILEIRTTFPWREVGEYLLGRGPEFKDIDRDGYDEAEKRGLTLDRWQDRLGNDATYDKLIEAMVKAWKIKEARDVCCLLKPDTGAEKCTSDNFSLPPGSETFTSSMKHVHSFKDSTLEDEKALHDAAKRGDVSAVRRLIASHVNVDCKPHGGDRTPLMTASFEGHVDIVRILIVAKAQVNTREEDGWTALHLAAQEGKVDVVRLLIEAKAHVNIQTEDGEAALYIACQEGQLPVVRLLLQKQADVSISKTDGSSPMHIACQLGYSEVVDVLVKNGANTNQQKNDGATSLYTASYNGHSIIVNALIRNGAVVNLACKDGASPLYVASEVGHSEIVDVLVKNRANINQPKNDGATPLYVATYNGHSNIVNTLIRNGADGNLAYKGWRPIDIARSQGHSDIVRILT